MSEILGESENRLSHKTAMDFYNAIKDIKALYPYLRSIQDEVDEPKKRFTCTIIITQPLSFAQAPKVKAQIVEIIGDIVLSKFPGFQCSENDIIFAVQADNYNTGGIDGACRATEKKFQDIHVLYDGSIFWVYGSAPCEHDAVRGEILAHIPHTIPCTVRFKSMREWEDDNSVSEAVTRANAAFAGVDVPSGDSFFSGLVLSLDQIREAVFKRLLPPR